MLKPRIALLSLSDGRERIHSSLVDVISKNERTLRQQLTERGVEVFVGKNIICSSELARIEARHMIAANVDAIVLNIPVFAFPNFAVIAVKLLNLPVVIITPDNGELPGIGGMLAAAGSLKQIGIEALKVWGELSSHLIYPEVISFLKAAAVVKRLSGQVYGLFGGRCMGMGTGTPHPDLWSKIFNVDVEHIGEIDIIRRANMIGNNEVDEALKWLETNCQEVAYDQDTLTRQNLAMQVKCYLATEQIKRERCLDFIGVKCHFELSEHYVTQCVSCSFFNDPYDWRGPKESTVFSCEADSDGALTMQILKLLSDQPTLLTDLRHYDIKEDLYVFCNCGAKATWFARQSSIPEENLSEVRLLPTIPKYRAGGAHVQLVAKEGEVTFARLYRNSEGYGLTLFKGDIVSQCREKLRQTCWEWPHAYAKIGITPENLFNKYYSNHAHFIYGDWISELSNIGKLLNISVDVID